MDKEEVYRLINNQSKKHGELSNATLIAKITVLQLLIKNSCDENLIKEIQNAITDHYNQTFPKEAFTRPSYQEELYLSEFDDRVSKNLKNKKFVKKVSNINSIIMLKEIFWYIYVIDRQDNLIIFNSPISTADLILTRNHMTINNTPIIHPLLLSSELDRVKTAGEFCTVVDNTGTLNIIFNNRSGHFIPHKESLRHFEEKIRSLEMKYTNLIKIGVG